MLVIRSRQLHALAVEDSAGLERRLFDVLEGEHPEEIAALGADETRALIRRGITTGLGCGLDTEDGLARLLALMIQLGEQLERSPDHARAWARLRHPTLPPELKIELTEQLLWERTGGRVVVPFAG